MRFVCAEIEFFVLTPGSFFFLSWGGVMCRFLGVDSVKSQSLWNLITFLFWLNQQQT
jgi:hypothetical protein